MYSIKFAYDKRGRGDILLCNDDKVVRSWEARTGSIDTTGALVNALPVETYKLLEKPVWTDVEAMCIDGHGWWCPLFTGAGIKTHYGFHPDGGKGGTKGCIGTQELSIDLKDKLDLIIKTQYQIMVFVECEV